MKEFIAYLESKDFAKRTQSECLFGVNAFFEFIKKDGFVFCFKRTVHILFLFFAKRGSDTASNLKTM